MEETGLIRFPANLDPQAPEFRPSRNIISYYHTLLLQPPIYNYPFIPTSTSQHHLMMPAYYYSPSGVAPPLPPPAAAATSSLLLSSVPIEATEETIRRDLQVFGEVREIEMERLLHDGIVIVHFYDLRHAQTAMIKIQEQYFHQQRRLRQYYFNFNHPIFMGNRWVLVRENLGSPPIPPPSCGGLIAGQAVWAQYTFPARRTVSDFPPPNPTSVSVGQLLRNPNQSSEYQQNLNKPEVGRRLNTWRNHRRSNHHTNSRNTHFISTSSENNSNCFLINEETVSARTTLMIKNIPNKYSQKLLINMLDNHCILCNKQITDSDDHDHQPLSSYDFVYLPIDFKNKCNMGYGFVNFTSPQAALRFYKDFNLQSWEVFGSRKICQVTYARLQGLVALKEYFKKSWFGCETDEYLPVMFSPARDGNQVTNPITIGNVHSGGGGGGGLCDGKERDQ